MLVLSFLSDLKNISVSNIIVLLVYVFDKLQRLNGFATKADERHVNKLINIMEQLTQGNLILN